MIFYGLIVWLLYLSLPSSHMAVAPTPILYGGIVPHHALVSHEIDDFWAALSQQVQPTRVILIGPDHNDHGQATMTTTINSSALGHGAQPDQLFIQDLMSQDIALADDEVFIEEHSMRIHLPYIAYYWPQAKVVPLLLRADTNQAEVIQRARVVRQLMDEHTIVVASVDFSHYLTAAEAEQNDQSSLAAIQQFNYELLGTYGPEHIDSDQSVVLVSEIICPQHNCPWEVYYHGNSGELPSGDQRMTTSYFSLFLTNASQVN